jgi:hypothetical protein
MNKYQIEDWLCKHNINKYTVSENCVVNVDDDVLLYNFKIEKLPFKFGKISGCFNCATTGITSLKNCPDYVGDYFSCSRTPVKSLKYCPKYVGGNFYAYKTEITSIKELFEIRICGTIIDCGEDIKESPEYKLVMKLQNLWTDKK